MFIKWMRAAAFAVAVFAGPAHAQAASGPITFNQLAVWAQTQFPTLFSGAPVAGSIAGYDYRYFADSGTYLAVNGTSVYVRGPFTQQQVVYVGQVHGFACNVDPALCAADRPLSALQSRLESGLASHSWSVFPLDDMSGAVLPRTVLNGTPGAERAGGAMVVGTQAMSIGGAANVATAYVACEATAAETGGYYVMWYYTLNDAGNMAPACRRGPKRLRYWGDSVYIQVEDQYAGRSALTNVSDVQITDIGGQSVITWVSWLTQVSNGSRFASFPAGSSLMRVFTNPGQETVYLAYGVTSGAIPPGATRLEDAFPYSGSCCSPTTALMSLNLADGRITTVNGRRVWYTTQIWPTYNALVEIDGRVRPATYYPASTEGWVTLYFNDIARDAILNAASVR